MRLRHLLHCAVTIIGLASAGLGQPPGTPRTWGFATYGGLGDGTTVDRNSPGPIYQLPSVRGVSVGRNHVLVLASDGTVLSAGYNDYGQLGTATPLYGYQPRLEPVPGLADVVEVAAGDYHNLARLADGSVVAWGSNSSGQLGDGTSTDRPTPVAVSGISTAKAISAGAYHSVALLANGHVRSWGYGGYGQLGDGGWIGSPLPVDALGVTTATAVSAGVYHTVALLADGTVCAWGYNGEGELGDGTFAYSAAPGPVIGLSQVRSVATSDYHTVAVLQDGSMAAWGYNGYGQLGDGTTTSQPIAVPVPGVTTAVSAATGALHTLALLADSSLVSWGTDTYGVLGNGPGGDSFTAAPVPGLTGIATIASSGQVCHAIDGDGRLYGWGNGSNAVLGDASSGVRQSPSLVAGLGQTTSLGVGRYHAFAVDDTGRLFGWGVNTYGALGDGSTDTANTPRLVDGLPEIKAATGGYQHSLALAGDGTVWSFGYNVYGQLGLGTTEDSHIPVKVPGVAGAVAVAASEYASFAVLGTGGVMAWGSNYYSELGTGSTDPIATTAVAVPGISTARAIACGAYHVLALLQDGTVLAWGDNSQGQLGDDTFARATTPIPVPGLANVVAIAAGANHSLAVLADGTVRAWGSNAYGQLGTGDATTYGHPVPVPGLTHVIGVAGGYYASMALRSDRTVRSWGMNTYGQLGDGSNTDRWTPVPVPGLIEVTHIAINELNGYALSMWRATTLQVTPKTGERGAAISLGALLQASTEAVAGREIVFALDGSAVGSGTTGATGLATLATVVPNAFTIGAHTIGAAFAGDVYVKPSAGSAALTVPKGTTSVYTVDRTGLVTTQVALKAYLKRTSDNLALQGETIAFAVAGTAVGSAVTAGAAGEAVLLITIATLTGTHTISAAYAGSDLYKPSSGSAKLTATSTATKVYVVDRTAKVKTYTVLKSYLYTPTNAIIPGKPMVIKLDGTQLASGNTNSSGYLQVGYTVAEGAGVGVRTIRGEFAGDGGYVASANTGKLTVTAGDLYIWPYVRSGKKGTNHLLKAYVRSLPDYVIQPGKSISFKVNGTDVGSGSVAADGWASATWAIPAGEPTGAHTAAAEFAGDAWYKAVTATTSFNVVP